MQAATALQRVAPAEPVVLPRSCTESDIGLSVTLRNIHKAFGAKPVLSGIDLHIPAGQFVAIVGKSGCGKSTLLRMVAGLETPSRGTLALGSGESARQAVRIMFQEPRLLPWARVQANVEVGLRPGHNGADGRRRAESLLTEVGLADRKEEWPSVLSGGQRQRVALARALASEPSVLALDEPLGALDALTRIEMQSLLEAVWLSQRFTAILVTHDVTEALMLADRVVLLDEGRVALDLPVPIARPRRRGSPEIGALEETILDRLFRRKPVVT